EKWHAAKPKSILNGSPTLPVAASASAKKAAPAPAPQYTQVFGEALVRECERDERVIGITAAMNSGTGLSILQKAMPERYFDVGIAEQQAILFAAGLALEGVKPVAAIYSTFLQRAYDQIVHDVCLQKLNVVFAMDRAGLVGDDGPTHHGAFDIAYLRCLPNMVLMAPRDEAMLVNMLRTALEYDDGPIALRYPRGEGTGAPLPAESEAIAIGTGEILLEAADQAGAPAAGAHARRRGAAVGLSARGGGRRRPACRADRLRQRRRQGARGGAGARGPGHRGDGGGRSLREADRRGADGAAGRGARSAGHGRGGRACRRLRLGGVGDAQRGRGDAADTAGGASRPLRHAWKARPAARGGGLHGEADRRACGGGHLRQRPAGPRGRVGDRGRPVGVLRGAPAAPGGAARCVPWPSACPPAKRRPRKKKRPAGEAGRFRGEEGFRRDLLSIDIDDARGGGRHV